VGLGHDVQSATRVGVSSRRSVLSASWDVSDVGWGTQTGGGSGAASLSSVARRAAALRARAGQGPAYRWGGQRRGRMSGRCAGFGRLLALVDDAGLVHGALPAAVDTAVFTRQFF
jgi:hypothetical protein